VTRHSDAVAANVREISTIWKEYMGDGHDPAEQALVASTQQARLAADLQQMAKQFKT